MTTKRKRTHTPGAWQSTEKDGAMLVETVADYPGRQAMVADCEVTYLSRAERSANATLIAAAPELLDACKEAVSGLQLIAVKPSAIDSLYLIRILESAIAKAEGKQP